jgi:hypothetical protein
MAEPIGDYRINLDGRWDLEDLSIFPHEYLQAYALCSHLAGLEILAESDPVLFGLDDGLGDESLSVPLNVPMMTVTKGWQSKYPWAGGYSAVNFYSALIHNLEPKAYPRIIEIKYASPGFISHAPKSRWRHRIAEPT